MKTTYISVPLLDEGTPTAVITPATPLGGDVYLLGTPKQYDPEDIVMEFLPGTKVHAVMKDIRGRQILLAVSKAE